MKKLILTITMIIILSGCSASDSPSEKKDDIKPSNWDPVNDLRWKRITTGEIIQKEYQRDKLCDRFPKCSNYCLAHGSYFNIIFTHGEIFSVGNIERPDLICKGQYGSLYKYNIGSPDNRSWFQWILEKRPSQNDKFVKNIISVKKPTIIIKKDKPVINEWIKSEDTEDLKQNNIVLIKLDNDIITTGFITYDKKWKLSFNINRYQYGKTLDNVLMWKRINLE